MTLGNVNLNNEVQIIGNVESDLKFSHEVYGEGFYSFTVSIMRLSDISDYINITVSDRLLKDMDIKIGQKVMINGQFRSYNNYSEEGNRLVLTVFARDIEICGEDIYDKDINQIFLNGFICKPPIYRITPFGREITDILIAVNRAYNKSDYIPCIAWGRNARFSSTLAVGENIKLWGRIQSRDYQKKISEDAIITKTAYEISVSKMEVSSKENVESDII